MTKQQTTKRYLWIGLALLIMFALPLLPAPAGMPPLGWQVLGIFFGALLLWLTVAIDWPSLLCITALGFIPQIGGFKGVITSSFGGETFLFLMATFLCTYALSQTGFLKRCALWFITAKTAQKSPWGFVTHFFFAVIVIGCFMSPSVLFVVFLPILEEIYTLLQLKKGEKLSEMLMIGLAFTVSISAGMTPIAHVFSIMAMGFYEKATGATISYTQYMGFGIPVGIIVTVLLLLVFRFILKPDLSKLEHIDFTALKKDLAPMDQKEKTVLSIFLLVVALWVLPSLLKPLAPAFFGTISSWGTAFPPLLGVFLYSVLVVSGKPLLDFTAGMKQGVPWASLVMAAGTLAVGAAMTHKEVGLTDFLTQSLQPLLANVSPLLLVFLLTAWACLQTNFSSNMVTVTVVTNVAIPLLLATGGSVNTPAVVSIIGMMSAFAFATPPAMPHIAIAAGTGHTNTTSLLKYGFIFMAITTLVAVFVGYPLASALM